jgi:hypothetical protein
MRQTFKKRIYTLLLVLIMLPVFFPNVVRQTALPQEKTSPAVPADKEQRADTEIDRIRRYIDQNMKRQDLLSVMADWEKKSNTVFTEEAKELFLKDYLLYEYLSLTLVGMTPENARERQYIQEMGLERLPHYLERLSLARRLPPVFTIWFGNALVETSRFKESTKESTDYFEFRRGGSSVPLNQYGRISVISLPDNAEIFIDGKFSKQYSNKEFVILTGSHTVMIKREGYQDCGTTVSVDSGKRYEVKCELKK